MRQPLNHSLGWSSITSQRKVFSPNLFYVFVRWELFYIFVRWELFFIFVRWEFWPPGSHPPPIKSWLHAPEKTSDLREDLLPPTSHQKPQLAACTRSYRSRYRSSCCSRSSPLLRLDIEEHMLRCYRRYLETYVAIAHTASQLASREKCHSSLRSNSFRVSVFLICNVLVLYTSLITPDRSSNPIPSCL